MKLSSIFVSFILLYTHALINPCPADLASLMRFSLIFSILLRDYKLCLTENIDKQGGGGGGWSWGGCDRCGLLEGGWLHISGISVSNVRLKFTGIIWGSNKSQSVSQDEEEQKGMMGTPAPLTSTLVQKQACGLHEVRGGGRVEAML